MSTRTVRLLLATAALVLPVGLGVSAGDPPVPAGSGRLPVTGKGSDILAPIDEALEKIMLRHGGPGAAVAVTKDGRLVYAKGFGWAHYKQKVVATADIPFGLASVSKVFTALAVLKLVEDGKLKLDDPAFPILKGLRPPEGGEPDPRLSRITVRHLLNHSGGWDRTKSGDPINWSFRISQRLAVPMPIGEDDLVRFMLGERLDFDPGTRAEYSNFGYIVLGRIIERVSGQSYEEYVRTRVLKPAGIEKVRLHDRQGKYFPGEARRYNPGVFRALGPYDMPWTDASGGWAASAVDLARLMTALDGSRTGKPFLRADLLDEMTAAPPAPLKPRPDGTYFGLGWDAVARTERGAGYTKGGSWSGVRCQVKHRLDGINTVLVCNAVPQLDPVDLKVANEALKEVQDQLNEVKEWPKGDLFDEFR